jgi:2,5-diketo-D-gluconate reductase A
VRVGGLPRKQVFVTTKLNGEWHGVDGAREALHASLDRLGFDYVDLYLIHWPMPRQDRYVQAWESLLKLREEGLARAVGVSNFKPAHIDRLLEATGIAPEVNQVELNPTVTRAALRAYDAGRGIATQSWSPLGQGGALLAHPEVARLAARHDKTPAQIVLRWHMELGLAAVPKSSSPERMAANIAIFDFRLTGDEVAALSSLDRGESAAVDSDVVGH